MIYNDDAASKTSVKLVSVERLILMGRQFLARVWADASNVDHWCTYWGCGRFLFTRSSLWDPKLIAEPCFLGY